jgi:septal ring factor EnvC (AmiA/AmiB activator)
MNKILTRTTLLVAVAMLTIGLMGCGPKMANKKQLSELDEAKSAFESAQTKYDNLISEKDKLETQKANLATQLENITTELNECKEKTGK